MKIGFIGLGRMGSEIAMRLMLAGQTLSVFDPDSRAAARLAAAGAVVAASVNELAAGSDVVISMLPNDDVLREVALAPGGLVSALRPGAIHMVSGTHGVNAISALAQAHRTAGQTLVACHVLGRPELAASGKLGLIPAGPEAAVNSLRPVFAAIGERVFDAGEDPLSATAVKVANNFILGCAIEAIGEGMALVRKFGVEPLLFYQVLVNGLFDSTAYRMYGDLIALADWGRVGASATIGLKDAGLALEAAQMARITLPSLSSWQNHLEQAVARGEAHLDWSVMAREQFRASGLE